MHPFRIRSVVFVFTALLISLPILALISSWLEWNAASAEVLKELAQTVLPDYLLTSGRHGAGVEHGFGCHFV
jgi:iron(III) transport system permease protein